MNIVKDYTESYQKGLLNGATGFFIVYQYRCGDYTGSRQEWGQADASKKRKVEDVGYKHHDNDEGEIDVKCRERMWEWSYRVVDHFGCNREILSVMFIMLGSNPIHVQLWQEGIKYGGDIVPVWSNQVVWM